MTFDELLLRDDPKFYLYDFITLVKFNLSHEGEIHRMKFIIQISNSFITLCNSTIVFLETKRVRIKS